jgi:hypothetical protein
MTRIIYIALWKNIQDHNLSYNKTTLLNKVKEIEKVIFEVFSQNVHDYYLSYESLGDRIRDAVNYIHNERKTEKELYRIAQEYEITPEQYEELFYILKMRAKYSIAYDLKMSQRKYAEACPLKQTFIKLSQLVTEKFEHIKPRT